MHFAQFKYLRVSISQVFFFFLNKLLLLRWTAKGEYNTYHGTRQCYTIFLEQQFYCSSFPFPHFYYRSTFFISHLLSRFLSLVLDISHSSFLPHTSVSAEFACTIYWPYAECTQPSARFIRHTRAHASAILRNFTRIWRCWWEPSKFRRGRLRVHSTYDAVHTYQELPGKFPPGCVRWLLREESRDREMSTCSLKISSF